MRPLARMTKLSNMLDIWQSVRKDQKRQKTDCILELAAYNSWVNFGDADNSRTRQTLCSTLAPLFRQWRQSLCLLQTAQCLECRFFEKLYLQNELPLCAFWMPQAMWIQSACSKKGVLEGLYQSRLQEYAIRNAMTKISKRTWPTIQKTGWHLKLLSENDTSL